VFSLNLLKSFFWFLAVLATALSFPLQVYANSPYPSLVPYFFIFIVLLLHFALAQKIVFVRAGRASSRFLFPLTCVYALFVVFTTVGQLAVGSVSIVTAGTAFFIYLLPTIWYWYFRNFGSETEMRAVLLAIVSSGVVVGVFFAYDSYSKLALNQISDYSMDAFQYTVSRRNVDEYDVNSYRVMRGARSFGLLETHSVSGVWIILGYFASIAVISWRRKIYGRFAIILTAVLLLLGLNVTSILSFLAILVMLDFYKVSLFGSTKGVDIMKIPRLVFVAIVLIGITALIAGDNMFNYIASHLARSGGVLTGSSSNSFFDLFFEYIARYVTHISAYPLTLVVGDGFSSLGMLKGGDIGYIESLARFGVPMFFVILAGMIKIVFSGLRSVEGVDFQRSSSLTEYDPKRFVIFSVSVLILVLVMEFHYSVWNAKSVFPVVFFALALYERFLTYPLSSGEQKINI
jgi:hypothetical protein